MKKINEGLQNLFKKEINLDYLKISITLISYLIIFSIFKAGYELKNFSAIKNKETARKIQEIKYYVKYKGKEKLYTETSPKDLFSLLDSVENMDLDYTEYYEGKMLKAVGNSTNFSIIVNGVKKDSNFFSNSEEVLPNKSKVEILN